MAQTRINWLQIGNSIALHDFIRKKRFNQAGSILFRLNIANLQDGMGYITQCNHDTENVVSRENVLFPVGNGRE